MLVKLYERIQREIMCKQNRVWMDMKEVKESNNTLIAGIDALPDNFDSVTGGQILRLNP